MSSTGDALTSVILGTSSLLAGTFFVNWAVDHRVIWQTATEASVKDAVAYYHDSLEGPEWLNGVMAGTVGLALLATLGKLVKGTTSRILFDGGSLFLLSAAVFMYAQNVLSSFKILSTVPRGAEKIPSSAYGAISQIASAHAIIAVTLTGVVSLQLAQYYSERQIEKEVKKEMKKVDQAQKAQQQKKPAVAPSSPAKRTPAATASGAGLAIPKTEAAQDIRRSPRKKR